MGVLMDKIAIGQRWECYRTKIAIGQRRGC